MSAIMIRKTGFTLVELLIVVVILGILAGIVLPKFSNATETARANMLRDDLRLMRSQLMVFKAQHAGVSAGYPDCDPHQTPTEATLVAHITMASNLQGQTAEPGTPGYHYGPYMRAMPENPINGKRSVRIIGDSQQFPNAPQGTHGWIYQPSTLIFKADCTGSDQSGMPFFDY
ncbi:MAG: type II secretion system protein [Planctomycetes bacterium]|nr:type II secretion system protein [Planctomycetota bacterium]